MILPTGVKRGIFSLNNLIVELRTETVRVVLDRPTVEWPGLIACDEGRNVTKRWLS